MRHVVPGIRSWVGNELVGRRLFDVLLGVLLPAKEEARLCLVYIIWSVVLEPTTPPLDLLNLVLQSVLEKNLVVGIFDDLF